MPRPRFMTSRMAASVPLVSAAMRTAARVEPERRGGRSAMDRRAYPTPARGLTSSAPRAGRGPSRASTLPPELLSDPCPAKTRADLEWDRLLDALAARCASPAGRRLCRALPFASSREGVLTALGEVREAVELDVDGEPLPAADVPDVDPVLDRARVGAVLANDELRALVRVSVRRARCAASSSRARARRAGARRRVHRRSRRSRRSRAASAAASTPTARSPTGPRRGSPSCGPSGARRGTGSSGAWTSSSRSTTTSSRIAS